MKLLFDFRNILCGYSHITKYPQHLSVFSPFLRISKDEKNKLANLLGVNGFAEDQEGRVNSF